MQIVNEIDIYREMADFDTIDTTVLTIEQVHIDAICHNSEKKISGANYSTRTWQVRNSMNGEAAVQPENRL